MDVLNQGKPDVASYHRELRRKSQDRIKVSNPTDEDFIVYWEKYGWRVRAHSTATFPRYIALNYVKHFLDHVKLDWSRIAADQEDAKRLAQGKELLTKYDGPSSRYQFEMQWINRNYNEEEWIKKIWLGVVEEYGQEMVTEEHAEKKPTYESILDSLSNLKAPEVVVTGVVTGAIPEPPKQPVRFKTTKEKAVKEVEE
jgi:hypothetical protein